MRIALTGGSGVVGTAIMEQAVARGDQIISVDRTRPATETAGVDYVVADLMDYEATLAAFRGADVLIHMAAIPAPFRDPDHVVHNNNVVSSYNALRSAIELGITRICQASSVNAIGLSYSRAPHFDYFPLDEEHPNYAEDAYSLSKWMCEAQADAFARRYCDLSIASLRFHWVVPDKATAAANFNQPLPDRSKHLWGYTTRDAAARACLLAVDGKFTGHEVFYIVAPDTTHTRASANLASEHFPRVSIRSGLEGNTSFFSSGKAERILGWRHQVVHH
ncbi:MAG: NAD(P)-dependent oxidoreductase [Devosia sp.]